MNKLKDDMTANSYEGLNIKLVLCCVAQCWNKMNGSIISRCFGKCVFRHEGNELPIEKPDFVDQEEANLQVKVNYGIFPLPEKLHKMPYKQSMNRRCWICNNVSI